MSDFKCGVFLWVLCSMTASRVWVEEVLTLCPSLFFIFWFIFQCILTPCSQKEEWLELQMKFTAVMRIVELIKMTCALFGFSCYSYRLCTSWTKILVDLETILLCVNRRVHEEFMKWIPRVDKRKIYKWSAVVRSWICICRSLAIVI